jgi:hypothetical protein
MGDITWKTKPEGGGSFLSLARKRSVHLGAFLSAWVMPGVELEKLIIKGFKGVSRLICCCSAPIVLVEVDGGTTTISLPLYQRHKPRVFILWQSLEQHSTAQHKHALLTDPTALECQFFHLPIFTFSYLMSSASSAQPIQLQP